MGNRAKKRWSVGSHKSADNTSQFKQFQEFLNKNFWIRIAFQKRCSSPSSIAASHRQQVLEQANVNKAHTLTRRTSAANVTTQQFEIGEISENSKFRKESSFAVQTTKRWIGLDREATPRKIRVTISLIEHFGWRFSTCGHSVRKVQRVLLANSGYSEWELSGWTS